MRTGAVAVAVDREVAQKLRTMSHAPLSSISSQCSPFVLKLALTVLPCEFAKAAARLLGIPSVTVRHDLESRYSVRT